MEINELKSFFMNCQEKEYYVVLTSNDNSDSNL